MGNNNFVVQNQSGGGNSSNVGIISGAHDNVAVLQKGQGPVLQPVSARHEGLTVDVLAAAGNSRPWTC